MFLKVSQVYWVINYLNSRTSSQMEANRSGAKTPTAERRPTGNGVLVGNGVVAISGRV